MHFALRKVIFQSVSLALLPAMVSCGSLAGPSAQNSPPKEQTVDAAIATKKLTKTTFRATAVAAIKQPVTSLRKGIAVFWHRPREVVVGSLPVEIVPQAPTPYAPGTDGFEKLLDEAKFPKAEYGRLKWLVDGKQFFGELDRQIAAAEQSIKVQLYIFDNDEIAVRYADKLRARSGEVEVKVLYDDFGTATAHLSSPLTPPADDFVPPTNMRTYLRDGSKVKVRLSPNPWLVADHTKLLLFDSRTAILGGMNIGREYYSEWHDLMVRVEGPIVGKLAAEFHRSWRRNGPFGDFSSLAPARKYSPPAREMDDIPVRILKTEAAQARTEVLDSSLLAIRGAQKRIYIENPYFANNEIIYALVDALQRGVDVRVVLPAEGDSAIMDAANLVTARTLIQAGGKIYRYPKMTHMKVMVCDDWASVGSANFDILSLRINTELNIAFRDKKEVERLVDRVFRPDFARSKRLRLKDTESLIAPFAKIIANQL